MLRAFSGKTMVPWLFTVISLSVILHLNSVAAENFTYDTEVFEDFEANLVACPSIIKVQWNEQLCREPHVIKYYNGTEVFYGGLFPGKL